MSGREREEEARKVTQEKKYKMQSAMREAREKKKKSRINLESEFSTDVFYE